MAEWLEMGHYCPTSVSGLGEVVARAVISKPALQLGAAVSSLPILGFASVSMFVTRLVVDLVFAEGAHNPLYPRGQLGLFPMFHLFLWVVGQERWGLFLWGDLDDLSAESIQAMACSRGRPIFPRSYLVGHHHRPIFFGVSAILAGGC